MCLLPRKLARIKYGSPTPESSYRFLTKSTAAQDEGEAFDTTLTRKLSTLSAGYSRRDGILSSACAQQSRTILRSYPKSLLPVESRKSSPWPRFGRPKNVWIIMGETSCGEH